MSDDALQLKNAPIIEAVLDIDCDVPVGFDLAATQEAAQAALAAEYLTPRQRFHDRLQFEKKGDGPIQHSASHALEALQFHSADGKQIVQVRAQGYSFNRLAPYTGLNDYAPEIRRTWEIYQGLVNAIEIQKVSLRYINRLELPPVGNKMDLSEYLEVCPTLPGDGLEFKGFLHQASAVDRTTGHQATIITTCQVPQGSVLPVILDISVSHATCIEPTDWPALWSMVESLRRLKNHIFKNTLTEACLNLFR